VAAAERDTMTATSLGSYRILEKIGTGGMGEVYRAHDPRLNRDVAVKVLPASFASDPDRLRRFTLEAQTAGGLNHPNVLTIYDIGSHDGQPFLASELLSGETLRAKLDRAAARRHLHGVALAGRPYARVLAGEWRAVGADGGAVVRVASERDGGEVHPRLRRCAGEHAGPRAVRA
jgi:hypothetical protein